jgi:hypothetical protein
MKKTKIYLLIHHEIFHRGEEYVDDEMVFQVASSVEKALEYIRICHVESYSWWEIQETSIDSAEWPEHYGWYGRRGGKLKNAPYKRAVAAYQRCKADPAHHLNV